jgi:predicted choloylglycine hydrolase
MRILLAFILLITLTGGTALRACTVVIAWKGDKVWVGNNEDWFDPRGKYWYEPAGKNDRFGAVFFGFKNEGKYAQGGMNEAGLFFDGLYIDKVKLTKETRKGKKAAPTHVFKKMLHSAKTVEEALEYLDQFFIPFIKSAQMVIADQTGDYAVINVNGVTRRKLPKEQFVVISNFPAQDMEPGHAIPGYTESCSLLEAVENPGLKEITRTLELSHQSGEVKSIYSNVFNLTDTVIYNYYLYDYRESFVIDLNDTENLPLKPVLFSSQFPGRMEAVGLD